MPRFHVALITCLLLIPIVGSAQDFDFEGAQELVQEWVRLTGEPGHRFVHYATHITSVMISDDARAEE